MSYAALQSVRSGLVGANPGGAAGGRGGAATGRNAGSFSLQTAGARSIGKSLGAARGIGPAINVIGSMGSSRALSSINSGRLLGAMNTPEKLSMHRSIFYLPRNEEMLYENALIENLSKFKDQELQKKMKLK